MECDVRDYIPWEEGGFLGKPDSATSGMTDKEIALSLGFTWPSLKVRLTLWYLLPNSLLYPRSTKVLYYTGIRSLLLWNFL
jgi:hypothetical protein